MTEDEWNEQRIAQYDLYDRYFKEGAQVHILCKRCRGALVLQDHYDFSGPYPKRQAICSNKDCREVRLSAYLVS